MAEKKHIEIALQGSEAIEEWKKKNPNVVFDLSDANLRRADLSRSNLSHANLQNANLEWGTKGTPLIYKLASFVRI